MVDILAVRTSLSLTQAEMAEKLGVNQSTLSRFETGALPIDRRTELAIYALQTAEIATTKRRAG